MRVSSPSSEHRMYRLRGCRTVIPPSLRRLRQEDGDFQASLGYMLSPYFNNKQK